MPVKLSSDEIYEAALDDALFSELPRRLAESVGARSCVLHWRHNNGAAEISTHSGYFTDAQMANYAANFVEHDLWTDAGMRDDRLNLALRTSDLVPADAYAGSIFYNDWIRAMGDDTFYCAGAVLQTPHGFGIIGLHRGASQGDFSKRAVAELERHGNHLRRMFGIRGRIADLTNRRDLLHELFASASEPAFAVTSTGKLIAANDAGERFLGSETVLRVRNGHVRPVSDQCTGFDHAIALACDRDDRRASDCILGSGGRSVVMASFLPLMAMLPTSAILVTIRTERSKPDPKLVATLLQQRFAMSRSEADVAVRLAGGQSVAEIAHDRQSSPGTVRTQIKHVLSKMEVRRQTDVVRLVSELTGRT